MRRLILGLLCVTTVLIPAPVVAGDRSVLMVDQDGSARRGDCDGTGPAYRSIQSAVSAADPGSSKQASLDIDVIRVCPGVYTETVDFRWPACSIRLIGARGSRPTIRAPRHIEDHPSPLLDRAVITLFRLPEPTWGCDISMKRLALQTHGGAGTCDDIDLIASWNAGLIIQDVRFRPADPVGGSCGTYGRGVTFAAEGAGYATYLVVTESVFRDFSAFGIESLYSTIDPARIVQNRFVLRNEVRGTARPVGIYAISGDINDNVMTRLGDGRPFGGIHVLRTDAGVVGNVIDGAAWGIKAEFDGAIRDNIILGRGDPLSQDGIAIGEEFPGGRNPWDVIGNTVSGFAGHGIVVWNRRLEIRDNDFRGNADIDCVDRTTGSRTSGTANTWRRNLGGQSSPAGICRPTLAAASRASRVTPR